MSLPLVSVVMPTHNYAHFIGEAIEGFLAQTYGHFELIIVDDASTDDTVDVLSRYRDDRIVLMRRRIWSCGNGDLVRNDGLAVARGEMIANAGADDISIPDRLERQVAFLQENPDVDIVGGGLIPVFGTVERKGAPVMQPVYRDRPERYRLELLEGKPVISNGTAMFRRHILDRLGGYRDYLSGTDCEFLVRASRYFCLCNLDRVLIYDRQHRDSMTRRYTYPLEKALHKVLLTREQLWGEHELEKLRSPRRRIRPTPRQQKKQRWPVSGSSRTRVSIVMPAYNNGLFIGEAIDSLLAQTYRNFELIIIDDASTDDTPEIVHAYQDARIVYLRREECTCSGNFARNDGLAISRGDLIALADADDIYVPDRLKWQVRFLERHPEVDILGGAMIEVQANGKDVRQITTRPVYDQPRLYRLDLLQGKSIIANPTMMFRRRVLDRVPGYNDFPRGADYEFQLRASRYFNFYNLKQVLAHYRQHRGSVTHRIGYSPRKMLHRTFLTREYLWGQKELERLQGVHKPQL